MPTIDEAAGIDKDVSLVLPSAQEWGPHWWYVMRLAAKTYGDHPTPTLRTSAIQFFQSLVKMLPCPECRRHYKQILQSHPVAPNLVNSAALLVWVDRVESEVTRLIAEAKAAKNATADAQNPSLADSISTEIPSLRQALQKTGAIAGSSVVGTGTRAVPGPASKTTVTTVKVVETVTRHDPAVTVPNTAHVPKQRPGIVRRARAEKRRMAEQEYSMGHATLMSRRSAIYAPRKRRSTRPKIVTPRRASSSRGASVSPVNRSASRSTRAFKTTSQKSLHGISNPRAGKRGGPSKRAIAAYNRSAKGYSRPCSCGK